MNGYVRRAPVFGDGARELTTAEVEASVRQAERMLASCDGGPGEAVRAYINGPASPGEYSRRCADAARQAAECLRIEAWPRMLHKPRPSVVMRLRRWLGLGR